MRIKNKLEIKIAKNQRKEFGSYGSFLEVKGRLACFEAISIVLYIYITICILTQLRALNIVVPLNQYRECVNAK